MISLVPTPAALLSTENANPHLSVVFSVPAEGALHIRTTHRHQLALLDSADPAGPLAVIIPLDAMAADRLSAVDRFLRARTTGKGEDQRLTRAQRRRIAHMLRAIDGHAEGASYLDLGLALFGKRLVSAPDWHDSSFRYLVMRLVRDGLRLIDGDYRQLLRFRRRQ